MATSVYVHFPWCLQKCPYCDFASAQSKRADVPHARYAQAVLLELAARAAGRDGGELASVFFGGGTPSLWEPRELGRVLAAIRAAFTSEAADLEVTVECNPSSLDADKARALREVGVNRLSVGVQSLDAGRLRYLGRLHDAAGALAALRAAQQAVPRVSADLMFGMPGQRAGDFLQELSRLLPLGLSHVSAYALTIEPQTQFGELHRKGRLELARDDDFADTYVATHEALSARGFVHYEVSSYARPGQSARHNEHYWRGDDYLGLGAAAVGRATLAPGAARRYRNEPEPERYMALAGTAEVEVHSEALDADTLVREGLMLGLRTRAGVSLPALRALSGIDPLRGRHTAVERAFARGELLADGEVLRVPHERWLHLDGIVARLF